MRILVAIDSSDASQAVIEEVSARPWPKGTNICVLNVVEAGFLGEPLSLITAEAASVLEMATDAARTLVDAGAKRLAIPGISISIRVVQGQPRIDIAEYAVEWSADLVMVGSRGRSGVTRILLGSVARDIVRHAPCSVEVVRARTRRDSEGMKILLATDGSAYSVAAAQALADRPWSRGTEVKIVSVVEVTPLLFEPFYIAPAMTRSLIDEQVKQAQESVSTAQQIISRAHLKTSSTMPLGSATRIILEQVDEWGADLVVVGSHGRHGVDRLLMGSVSESIAIHAPCSVEVIRTKAASQ